MNLSSSEVDTIVISMVGSAFTAGLSVGIFYATIKGQLKAFGERLGRIENLFTLTWIGQNYASPGPVPPPGSNPWNPTK